jgi:deoxyribose-phosphate aldolase
MKLRDFFDLCLFGKDVRVFLNEYNSVVGAPEDLKIMLADCVLDEEVSGVRAVDYMINIYVDIVE